MGCPSYGYGRSRNTRLAAWDGCMLHASKTTAWQAGSAGPLYDGCTPVVTGGKVGSQASSGCSLLALASGIAPLLCAAATWSSHSNPHRTPSALTREELWEQHLPWGCWFVLKDRFPDSGYTVVLCPSSSRFGQAVVHFLPLLLKETSGQSSGCRWPSGRDLPQKNQVQGFTGLSNGWHGITAGGREGAPASHQDGKRKWWSVISSSRHIGMQVVWKKSGLCHLTLFPTIKIRKNDLSLQGSWKH